MDIPEDIQSRYNVNVNKSNSSNVNVNNVRATALKLSTALDDPASFKFYCKLAWCLPESMLMLHLEAASKGRDPKKLFTYLCKLELDKLQD